jgi:tetratricopeptide (TPR) repeat protein
MEVRDNLQRAIETAHAGRELMAREMFLDIVEAEPQNELAWLWLVGLLDELDERIYACKKVLAINPANTDVRQYLAPLLAEKQKAQDAEKLCAKQQLQQAHELFRAKKSDHALYIVRGLTRLEIVSPDAWRTLADFAPQIEEQIHALRNLLKLAPGDAQAQEKLQQLEHYQQNPLEVAALYEEQGQLEKAIAAYNRAALLPDMKNQWDAIYWKISRLQNLRQEKIIHISPVVSIARLTFGPALLYLALTLVQVGNTPFAPPYPLLWVGLIWVLLGGFMSALATVHSSERLKTILAKGFGASGIPVARSALAIGWILILLPYVLLFVVAYQHFVSRIELYSR